MRLLNDLVSWPYGLHILGAHLYARRQFTLGNSVITTVAFVHHTVSCEGREYVEVDSDAGLADDLRNEVYDMVRAGGDKGEIVDFLVQRYGDFVLYRPPVKSSTAFLWFGPFLFLLVAGILVLRFVRNRPKKVAEIEFSEADKQRVAEALRAATKPGGPLCAGGYLKLDEIPFSIESASWGESSGGLDEPGMHTTPGPLSAWAAATTYQELSSPLLLSKEQAPRRLTLKFASPTTFKSGGVHLPVPLPDGARGKHQTRALQFPRTGGVAKRPGYHASAIVHPSVLRTGRPTHRRSAAITEMTCRAMTDRPPETG